MSTPDIPQYRPFGEPAKGAITVKNTPSANDTVTINGDVYTYGEQFFGTDPLRAAQSLAAAIRSDTQVSRINVTKAPIRPYTAYYFQNTVIVVACEPGEAGNSMAMLVSNTQNFDIDATLIGGTDKQVEVLSSPAPLTNAGNDTVTTNSTGTNYQTLASHLCKFVTVFNNTGTDLLVQRGGSGAGFVVADGFGKSFPVIANSNELAVKRMDSSNTTVSITYEYLQY